MLKISVSILLSTVMLFMAFGKSMLVLNYEINKKEITETLCENRDKPQMNCNGHCFLSKQLKKAEEKQNAVPNYNNLKELSPFIPTEITFIGFSDVVSISFHIPTYEVSVPVESCPGSVFQPPEA